MSSQSKNLIENVAIANALQLEAARATPALFRFNYDAMHAKFDVAKPIHYHYSVFAADILLCAVT